MHCLGKAIGVSILDFDEDDSDDDGSDDGDYGDDGIGISFTLWLAFCFTSLMSLNPHKDFKTQIYGLHFTAEETIVPRSVSQGEDAYQLGEC